MKIKIIKSNSDKIEMALSEINGYAISHTFTNYGEIVTQAHIAEKQLDRLLLPKKLRNNAQAIAISGDNTANVYNYLRIATEITLFRNAGGDWFLIDIKKDDIYRKGGHDSCIWLSKETSDEAVDNFKKQYVIR